MVEKHLASRREPGESFFRFEDQEDAWRLLPCAGALQAEMTALIQNRVDVHRLNSLAAQLPEGSAST